jgi:very-short-patch-repair endonuclease
MLTMANERARKLRTEATNSERIFWSRVRNNQLGVRFRRQHPIGTYIVDFVCLEQRLVIEIDGSQHDEPEQKALDEVRTAWAGTGRLSCDATLAKDVDQIVWEILLHLGEGDEPRPHPHLTRRTS